MKGCGCVPSLAVQDCWVEGMLRTVVELWGLLRAQGEAVNPGNRTEKPTQNLQKLYIKIGLHSIGLGSCAWLRLI